MGSLTPIIMGLVLPVFRGWQTMEQALENLEQIEKVKSVQQRPKKMGDREKNLFLKKSVL